MPNIFDDIYQKKLNISFKDLNRTRDAKQSRKSIIENYSNYTNADLENILSESRANPGKRFNEKEAFIIQEQAKKNLKEAYQLIDKIKEKKKDLYQEVSSSEYKYVLDMKGKEALLDASTNVFGGRKKSLSYEDYITLLEMRKQIQFDETRSLMEGAFDDF